MGAGDTAVRTTGQNPTARGGIPRTGAARAPLAGPRVLPMPTFRDDFDGDVLDPAVWDPHYLPAWSSRAATAAASPTWPTSRLRLWVPPDQPAVVPRPAPRLPCGSRASPPAATRARWGAPSAGQRFLDGQHGARATAPLRGLAAHARDRVAVRLPDGALGPLDGRRLAERLRGVARTTPASCAWSRSSARTGVPRRSAEVGMGIKKLRDPRLEHDFEAPRLPIDVGQWHEYAVRWDEQRRGVLGGRRARPHLRPPADVPAPGHDRGLRLPGLAGRRDRCRRSRSTGSAARAPDRSRQAGRVGEHPVDRGGSVEPAGVEGRHGGVVGPDQQPDLGAAEDHPLGAVGHQVCHHPAVDAHATPAVRRRAPARRR